MTIKNLSLDTLDEVRQIYASGDARECVNKFWELFYERDETSEKEGNDEVGLVEKCKELALLTDGFEISDINNDEQLQEILLMIGISLLRTGQYANEVRKLFEKFTSSKYKLLVSDYYLEACNFVEENVKKADTLSDTHGSVSNSASVKYNWYQNSGNLVICIYAKGVSSDTLIVKAGPWSISVFIKLREKQYYFRDFSFLYREIIEDTLKIQIYTNMVEIKVAKKDASTSWGQLQLYDKDFRKACNLSNDTIVKGENIHPKPLYKKTELWEEEIKKLASDEVQSEDSLEAMFRKIYDNSDDDSKRAMLKSYYESSGTCLSTNWNEVSKKKVDIVPPEGTISKKFN